MLQLTREVRCFWPTAAPPRGSTVNSWSGWPGTAVLAPFLTWQCTLRGPISPQTDYVSNVKWIDQLLRDQFLQLRERHGAVAAVRPIPLIREMFLGCQAQVAAVEALRLACLRLGLSPYLYFELDSSEESMVRVTHEYEFSASHRLHHSGLSDEQNREIYGKCNNPHGHGHNYVLQVTWKLPVTAEREFSLEQCDAVVKQRVIDRLDHRYLNREVPPFDGRNPTVENIAVTIWEWLVGHFAEPVHLLNVRVYETPKTWADYCAQ